MRHAMFALLVICTLGIATSAHAYETTSQRALRVNDRTALFFIDYTFGQKDHDLYLPVLATRNQSVETDAPSLGFEVLDQYREHTNAGIAQAIVLSDAAIDGNLYHVPQGFAAGFTLAVVFVAPEGASINDYSIAVTDLPFYQGDEKRHMYLNPSELQYYKTPQLGDVSISSLQDLINAVTVTVTGVSYRTK
jgi:hypothetical protein